jgi:hypothetical protein
LKIVAETQLILVSVTTSIAGLGQLASSVFTGLARYVNEDKYSQRRVAILEKETGTFS